MRLRWRSFERKLRREALRSVRASEKLLTDYRQQRRRRWRDLHIPPWAYRMLFMGLAVLVLHWQPLPTLVAAVTLWTVGSFFHYATRLGYALYQSPALDVFNHLPLSDESIFDVQFKRFVRDCLWCFAELTIAYSLLAGRAGYFWHGIGVGFLFGLCQYIFMVIAAVCLFAFGPRRYLHLPGTVLRVGALALVLFGSHQPIVITIVESLSHWVPLTGWMIYAMGISASGGLVHNMAPAVLAGLVIALFPMAYRAIRGAYALSEEITVYARRANSSETVGAPFYEWAERFKESPADAEAAIRERGFLHGIGWRTLGPVERVVSLLLTAREQTLAELLVGGTPQWSHGLRRLFLAALVAAGAIWVFGPLLASMGGILAFLAVYLLVAAMIGNWRGLASSQPGQRQPPFYSFYPVSFREMTVLMLKINSVRYLLFAPVIACLALLAIYKANVGESVTIHYGLKILGLGLLVQPLLVLAPISPCTNDTRNFSLTAMAVLLICGLIAAAFVFVFATGLVTTVISAVVVGALSVALWLLYGRHFDRTRIDLVPLNIETARHTAR